MKAGTEAPATLRFVVGVPHVVAGPLRALTAKPLVVVFEIPADPVQHEHAALEHQRRGRLVTRVDENFAPLSGRKRSGFCGPLDLAGKIADAGDPSLDV